MEIDIYKPIKDIKFKLNDFDANLVESSHISINELLDMIAELQFELKRLNEKLNEEVDD